MSLVMLDGCTHLQLRDEWMVVGYVGYQGKCLKGLGNRDNNLSTFITIIAARYSCVYTDELQCHGDQGHVLK